MRVFIIDFVSGKRVRVVCDEGVDVGAYADALADRVGDKVLKYWEVL